MFSKIENGRLIVDRRDVIRGGLAAGALALLPAGAAQAYKQAIAYARAQGAAPLLARAEAALAAL